MPVPPSNTIISEEILSKSDNYVQKMMDSLEIVGLSYAVLVNGKLAHKKAMGLANIEHQVLAKTSSLYPVASISKLFSSTALNQLLKSTNRSVDETIEAFLPNQSNLPKTWKKVTLKHLLSHTSGLPDLIDYGFFLTPESAELVIDSLKDKPFNFNPGESTRYNATGFMLIRMIIEELSGQAFEAYMQEKFFDRFSMTKTCYGGLLTIIPNRVTSYQMLGENFKVFPLDYTSPMYAAAGLNTSVEELALWMEAILTGQILDKDYLNIVWSPVKLNNNTDGVFGLGWETSIESKYGSTGHGGAGISSLRHYWQNGSTNTVTVILLTNGAKNWIQTPDDINRGIANYFMPDLLN